MNPHAIAAVALLAAGAAFAREGDLDPRFAGDGQYTVAFDQSAKKLDQAVRTLVDKRGRYVMVGYADYARVGLARLLPNGDVDASYAGGGAVDYPIPSNATITDAAIDTIDRIVVIGYGLNPLDNDPFVCRYSADGVPDVAVGENGCHFIPIDYTVNGDGDDRAYAVTNLGDAGGTQKNDLLIAGSVERNDAGDFDFAVIRLTDFDLQPAEAFGGGDGIQTIPFDVSQTHAGGDDDRAYTLVINGIYAYIGGYAYVGGFAQSNDFALAKILVADGTEVATFCPDDGSCGGSFAHTGKRTFSFGSDDITNGFDERIGAIATQNGLLVVAGDALYGSKSDVVVARLTPNGALMINPDLTPIHQRIHIFDETRLGGLTRLGKADFVAGTTAAAPGSANPLRVLWAGKLEDAYLQFATDFVTAGNSSDWLTSFVFPRYDDTQPIDQAGGRLCVDRGRIVLTGSRLWSRDLDSGLDDFDYAIARMQGDSIFLDGLDY